MGGSEGGEMGLILDPFTKTAHKCLLSRFSAERNTEFIARNVVDRILKIAMPKFTGFWQIHLHSPARFSVPGGRRISGDPLMPFPASC